jgi:hypothetical protein
MHTLSKYEIWYGRDCLPPERTTLRAGPLTLEFEEGDIRYTRLGQQELVRRVYVGIRDHNWNTIPGKQSDLKVDTANNSFTVTFDSSHRAGPLQFDWRATITGSSDGTITYVMDGTARSAFRYCRIGFCVLHPIRECAGRPYRAQTPDGPVGGNLPLLIGPQLIENGLETPLFPSCSALTIALDSGLEVSTEFEGDLFEMEDQRNWTDGSFKTYCTPISLGYPHQASEGESFHQKVIIEASPIPADMPAPAEPSAGGAARLTLGQPLGHGLPEIGFSMAGHGGDLTPQEAGLLSALRPAHLKAELHFRDPRWMAELNRAIVKARQIGTRLELAVFLDGDVNAALKSFKHLLAGAPLARLLVFHETEANWAVTSSRWVQLVRANLESAFPNLAIGGGTNGNFAELNRAWPDTSGMDALSFTINPQVHAADERSLVEALEPQESTVLTSRANCGRLPVCVSSVTLRPPFNQAATEEEEPPDPNELPPSVDPRQMSLFAAAWTVGSIRALTTGGAASVTYYETTGWRGLLETEHGTPLPDRFRSRPGMIFPVYHVFADLAEVADAEAVATVSSDPLSVQGLALCCKGRWRVLVASLLSSAQRVTVGPFRAGLAVVRRLNDSMARLAMFEPERFRELRESQPLSSGKFELALGPYETVCLDIEEL